MLSTFPICRIVDPTTEMICGVQVAFEVLVKPGSYVLSEKNIGASHELDPQIPNHALQWSTTELENVIQIGLLVKVDVPNRPKEVGKNTRRKSSFCDII